MTIPSKSFIETSKFPVSEVSEASAGEKGLGRPPHWEMVFWWTRKPLISARAIIAGSLLPEDINRESFLINIGAKGKGSPHRKKPSYKFENLKLLDPFAGFGSIPLEALRLGLSATAVELIPVAYIFLKAVLEYPSKYGESLIKEVRDWGNWVTKKLREDQDVKELYEEDVTVYIGSWEVKCPNCSRWTSLVGNWWLARVYDKKDDKKVYKRLAWMQPKVKGDMVEIEVVDLNKLLSEKDVKEAKIEENRVKCGTLEYRVPESNIETKREQAICLLCNQPIRYIDKETGRHIVKPSPGESKNLIWYVKCALSKYNDGDEELAKPRLLVKVKIAQGDLEFEPCTTQDQERLGIAKQKIQSLLEQKDPDIPIEPLAPYGTQAIGGYLQPLNYNMTEWYKLFNPRQLLALVKLTKLIREAGKLVEQEKLKEGLSQDEAYRYAEAVTTYLAVGLIRLMSFNSIVTSWYSGSLLTNKVQSSLTFRGIAMTWNWGDTNILYEEGNQYSVRGNTNALVRSLSYLVPTFGNSPSLVSSNSGNSDASVLLDDATVLSRLDSNDKLDLIVTDPPYYSDVPYAELSDFYYVWLKRALSDVKNGRLVARFTPEAFFEKISDSWVEIPTQWERYALSEVSLNPPRLGPNATMEDGIKHFQNLLNASFTTMASRLKDKGLLVTYYAHTDPDAWKALLEAGWQSAGLKVTNAFPFATESATSVVSRGKLSMDTSIVVVWRKGLSQGPIDASVMYEEMVEGASSKAKELIDMGTTGRDLVIGSLASTLATATKYREVRTMGKLDMRELVDKYVYPATLLGLARALARKAELKETVRSPDAMFYLIVKFTLSEAKKKIIESTDARIFSIGTSLDLNQAIGTMRILKGEAEKGAKVAKAKTLTLVEPTSTDRSKLAELLEAKEVGVTEAKIRCTVDALHVLEYYAVTYSREEFKRRLEELKAKYLSKVEEAISMAKIMARVLPNGDVEKSLCMRILEHLEPGLGKMTQYIEGEP